MSVSLNKKYLTLGVAGAAAFAAASWLSQAGDPEIAIVQPVSRSTRTGNLSKPSLSPSPQTASQSALKRPERNLISFENMRR